MTTTASSDLLETLAAERALYRTFFHYFRLVDTAQWDRIAEECFTPDISMTYDLGVGPPLVLSGHAEIKPFYSEQAKERFEYTAHVVGQTLIEWGPDGPTLTSYTTAWHWFSARAAAGKQRPADWSIVGMGVDNFVEVDGKWLIARRVISAVGGPVLFGALA